MKWGSLEIIHSGSAPHAVFWIESFQFLKFEEAQFKIYCTLSLCVHSLQFCNLPDQFCDDKEKYHSELTLDEIFPRKEKQESSLNPKKSPKLVTPAKTPPTTIAVKPTSLSTTPEVTTTTTTMVTDASTTSAQIELTLTSQLTHPASKKNRKWSKKSRSEKKSSRPAKKTGRGRRSLGLEDEILTIDFGEISPGHNYTLFLN